VFACRIIGYLRSAVSGSSARKSSYDAAQTKLKREVPKSELALPLWDGCACQRSPDFRVARYMGSDGESTPRRVDEVVAQGVLPTFLS